MTPYTQLASRLLGAASRIRLYGREHALTKKAIADLRDTLDELWTLTPEVRISLEGNEVQIQGEALRSQDGPADGLHRRLSNRGLGFVRLAPSLSPSDLEEFCAELGSAGSGSIHSRPGLELGALKSRSEPESDLTEVARIRSVSGQQERPAPEEARELARLEHGVREHYEVRVQDYRQIALSLVSHLTTQGNLFLNLAEIRDHNLFTYLHTCNVCLLTMSLGGRLGLPGRDVFDLGVAALLHDLGKSFVPAEILDKPGRLNEEEWRIVRQHPEAGARLLMEQPKVHHLAVVVAYEHHMRYDGDGGYPQAPYQPSPQSQLIAITDSFDAIFGSRSYHRRYDVLDALEILRSQRGRAYHPELVDVFERLVTEDLDEVFGDREELRG